MNAPGSPIADNDEILRNTRAVLQGFSKKPSSLIPVLQAVQEKLGYLPKPSLLAIADYLDMPAFHDGTKDKGAFILVP